MRLIFLLALALASRMAAHAAIEIETSYVGDIGNSADSTGYGAVNYGYYIGTYEVTNSQYVSFLNATGQSYPTYSNSSSNGIQRDGTSGSYSVKPGMGNKPVLLVTFWNALRFANWLTNGQGDGDTEDGMYTLTTEGMSSNTITRNAAAWNAGGVALVSEDEWYKAAYHQPVAAGGDTDSYWLYPTASNETPSNDLVNPFDVGNSANFYRSDYTVGSPIYVTDVGEFENSGSYYGTFDQGGNAMEWNESSISDTRCMRGGNYGSGYQSMRATDRYLYSAASLFSDVGFRVSSLSPITSGAPPTTEVPATIHTAVEIRFNAATGVSYRIEGSTDLDEWGIIETGIIGEGVEVARFYSTESQSNRFFRVRKN